MLNSILTDVTAQFRVKKFTDTKQLDDFQVSVLKKNRKLKAEIYVFREAVKSEYI